MQKAVKLEDIANKLGVSTVTVSKALSGKKGVSEELRERIKVIADELGYKQPSVARREVALNKGYQIGVIIQTAYLDKYESFYWQLYQQVSTTALAMESFTLLEVIDKDTEINLDMPKLIREKRIHGLIIIGNMSTDYIKMLKKEARIPIVFLDFTDSEEDTDAVVSDSYYGAYQMTKYLIANGHKKIGYVGTLNATGSITDRYFGYQKALMEYSIVPLREWQIDDRVPETSYVSDELLKLPENMPTAFFCNCDLTAGKLIKKLKHNGYRVPEDISVVGFDNFIFPGACDIGITTYEVDQYQMAKKAVKILLERITKTNERYGTHVIGGKLIIKESVRNLNIRNKR